MIYKTGLIFLVLILSAAKAAHLVQTGADIHFCRFQCYEPQGILQLRCNVTLVLAECWNSVPIIHHVLNQRLLLNHDNGCWMMKNVQKNDTGLYQTFFFSGAEKFKILKSTEIIVLDPVKIHNISINYSLGGSDISLEVSLSGDNARVFWELDGRSLPLRYILKYNNRTLIIRNANKEDEKGMFVIRVLNPISEDKREYHLVIPGNRKKE
ncbi:uncharacterized protein [Pyxicephalus adspersus]|uniref:uncharacterized protein n=1 Tax=Pyxicephalus adspersus TaxID=30357 RepID=UPI003B5A03C9